MDGRSTVGLRDGEQGRARTKQRRKGSSRAAKGTGDSGRAVSRERGRAVREVAPGSAGRAKGKRIQIICSGVKGRPSGLEEDVRALIRRVAIGNSGLVADVHRPLEALDALLVQEGQTSARHRVSRSSS
jgi:hypothetical protein